MNPMLESALQLLQTTKVLFDAVNTGDLSALDHLQGQRAKLIRELDLFNSQSFDDETLRQVRKLIEQSRQLEDQATQVLEQQRDDVNRELSKLRTSKKARKAYGEF